MRECLESNTIGTNEVINFCFSNKIKLIYSATSATIGNSGQDKNLSPYAFTKAKNLELLENLKKWFKFKYEVVYFYNVYGPNQYPEKAIPKFIILASRGKQIALHGDGLATRSYMHVDDAASAFDFILHKGQTLQVYNIGAHEERTVLSVAEDVCELLGRDPKETITYVRDRAFNDRRYFIDCSKLLALGWQQKISWEEGLSMTVKWYTTQDLSSYWREYESALRPHPTLHAQPLGTDF